MVMKHNTVLKYKKKLKWVSILNFLIQSCKNLFRFMSYQFENRYIFSIWGPNEYKLFPGYLFHMLSNWFLNRFYFLSMTVKRTPHPDSCLAVSMIMCRRVLIIKNKVNIIKFKDKKIICVFSQIIYNIS